MKRFVAAILFILGGLSLSAQSFEEYKARARKEFDEYRSQREQDFRAYREKVNAEFAEYMRQAWRRYEGEPAVPEPPKIPDIPPVVLPDLGDPEVPDNEIPYIDVIPFDFEDMDPIPLLPLPETPEHDPVMPDPIPEGPMMDVLFYGTRCAFRFNPDDRSWLKDSSEDSAADMWEDMCRSEYDNLLLDCLESRRRLNLCDWAYYELTQTIASEIYGDGNETVLLTAFLMNQSGFRLRLGRDDDGCFHILIGADGGIYGCPYFKIGSHDYFLTDGFTGGYMDIFTRDYPNEKSIRLFIDDIQDFEERRSGQRTLVSERYPSAEGTTDVNLNLMDFYQNYPHPFRDADRQDTWVFYAEAPLSSHLKEQLLDPLATSIEGLSQEDAANVLINFVQTAFEYQTDDEQWGYERPFFPEETLFYPYSDCEDRSILFARLVKELMGLDVVFLHYPGHLATAVRFDEAIAGDHLMIEGGKYLVCDPTYINASIGMQMPQMEGKDVNVIRITN